MAADFVSEGSLQERHWTLVYCFTTKKAHTNAIETFPQNMHVEGCRVAVLKITETRCPRKSMRA